MGGANHLHGFTAVIVLVDRRRHRDDVDAQRVEVPRIHGDGPAGEIDPSPGLDDLDEEIRRLLDPS